MKYLYAVVSILVAAILLAMVILLVLAILAIGEELTAPEETTPVVEILVTTPATTTPTSTPEVNSKKPTPVILATATTPEPVVRMDEDELAVFHEINEYRAKHGKTPLISENGTCGFAEYRAVEIASDFSHDGFYDMSARAKFYGSYISAAENLASDYGPDEVVSRWIESPTHNENLLRDMDYGCAAQVGDYWALELLNI